MFFEVVVIVVLFTFLYQKVAKPFNLPPGTFGVPLLGNIPPRNKTLTQHFLEMKQEYGDIFTTKWGVHKVIVFTTYDVMKSAFTSTDFRGRLQGLSSLLANKNGGISLAAGDTWHSNRKFFIEKFCGDGTGKTGLETSTEEEVRDFVQYLEHEENNKSEGTSLDVITVPVSNILWKMLTGRRYKYDDERILKLISNNEEDLKILQGRIFFFDFLPILHSITPAFIFDKITGADKLEKHRDDFKQTVMEIVSKHEENLDVGNPQDYIDHYLVEKKKVEEKHRDYNDLVLNLSDLFSSGSGPTASTLKWILLYSAMHPEFQTKIQSLLDANVPQERLPTLADRPNLPYLDAFILEATRFSSLYPIGQIHTLSTNSTFMGFHLPKGTVAIAALELIHREPNLWTKPDEFHPEHFLTDEGLLDETKEGYVAFSLGQRKCVGESISRTQLFLFSAAVLQRFTVSPPAGVTLDASPDTTNLFFNHAKQHKLVFKKRL